MKKLTAISVFVVLSGAWFSSAAQRSVFHLVQDFERKGDQLYAIGSYRNAIDYYENLIRRGEGSAELLLKAGRAYFRLHQYGNAANCFRAHVKKYKKLPDSDALIFADALTACNEYDAALDLYTRHCERFPDDEWIRKKIWRLRNATYLFEDSLQYSVRYLPINTSGNEFGAFAVEEGLIFVSDHYAQDGALSVDAMTNTRFYRPFQSNWKNAADVHAGEFGRTSPFGKGIRSKFHNGPMALYHNGTKMVFAASVGQKNKQGLRPLHLFFAEKINGTWKVISSFPYNEPSSSNTEPFISADGNELYFSSDREGGHGGKDLYRCVYRDGRWQAPVNLGPSVNSPYDEGFPFVSEGYLYFSSNGHPGLGGIDIFRIALGAESFGEVTNLGYPVNTHSDDFGLSFTSEGYRGYFASSRGEGGDDDIYELLIDQQTYPIAIHGVIKQRENTWIGSDSLRILPAATLFLVDHARNITVGKSMSDKEGYFSIDIPYFSFYRLRVIQSDGAEAIVSFEIPRKRIDDYFHEIVIIKDAFIDPPGDHGDD